MVVRTKWCQLHKGHKLRKVLQHVFVPQLPFEMCNSVIYAMLELPSHWFFFMTSKFKPGILFKYIGKMHMSLRTCGSALGSVCPCRSTWCTPGWMAPTLNYWRNCSKSGNRWKRSRKPWGKAEIWKAKHNVLQVTVQLRSHPNKNLHLKCMPLQDLGSHMSDPCFLVPKEDSPLWWEPGLTLLDGLFRPWHSVVAWSLRGLTVEEPPKGAPAHSVWVPGILKKWGFST